MALSDRIAQLRAQLDQLQANVRPEGAQTLSAIRTTVDQLEAEAGQAAAPAPDPLDVQLAALAANVDQVSARLVAVGGDVATILERTPAPEPSA